MAFRPFNKEAPKQTVEVKKEPVEEVKVAPKEEKPYFVVVDKLPTQEQEIRERRMENGQLVRYVTFEEALTFFLNQQK